MADDLKAKTLKGVFWSGLDRIGNQVVGFVVSIVLARLLAPSDYGVIGILTVFISVSQLFIDCGLSTSLIRQKKVTDEDCSTVFWFNLIVALLFYIALFVSASYIAEYYRMPILCPVLRVLGFVLVINALYTIQVTRLTVRVDFKTQARVSLCRCIFGGCVGVGLASFGFGVWALVWQNVSGCVLALVLYWLIAKWHPHFSFYRESFTRLVGFGSKIMLANLLNTIYVNLSPLIIGRKYTAADLGYYSRGDGLACLPACLFDSTLSRVIYPVLSSIQDDAARLKAVYSKYLKIITSIVAPTMLILAAVSQPLVVALIGEKWLPCVPYMQLLAVGWVVDPIIQVNNNVLYVKGRGDLVLKLEFTKKIIAIILVLLAVQFGVVWLCVARVVYGYIALAINIQFCKPLLGMGFWLQMRDVAPIYILAAISAVSAYAVVLIVGSRHLVLENLIVCVGAAMLGCVFFVVAATLAKNVLFMELAECLKCRVKNGRMLWRAGS